MSIRMDGFSQLSKNEKVNHIHNMVFKESLDSQLDHNPEDLLKSFWHSDPHIQKIFDEFSENTLSNFYLPFGVAPHFVIDEKSYCIPMVTEESSVVAAASKSGKFWAQYGGFSTHLISTRKNGQVHFLWKGDPEKLKSFYDDIRSQLFDSLAPFLVSMQNRGGGLVALELKDQTHRLDHYYQIHAEFETCDAMGANFINTVLENCAKTFLTLAYEKGLTHHEDHSLQIIMSILSNYTPECLVESKVQVDVKDLKEKDFVMPVREFLEKFQMAIAISKVDVYRATTHNKGIFNGIDAVGLATGNDFRAIEACGHAYAARSGTYSGLTDVSYDGATFTFSLTIPLALGTVGGMTSLHPLSQLSLRLLGHPSANQLMKIIASVGLAQNFSAVRSLVTTGIQKGHMKMHLLNILNQLQATEEEREKAKNYFTYEVISFSAVKNFIHSIRRLQ
jgi:hydroxymethylglutaryl-CoA reductase